MGSSNPTLIYRPEDCEGYTMELKYYVLGWRGRVFNPDGRMIWQKGGFQTLAACEEAAKLVIDTDRNQS